MLILGYSEKNYTVLQILIGVFIDNITYLWADTSALNYKICKKYGDYILNCSTVVKWVSFKRSGFTGKKIIKSLKVLSSALIRLLKVVFNNYFSILDNTPFEKFKKRTKAVFCSCNSHWINAWSDDYAWSTKTHFPSCECTVPFSHCSKHQSCHR